MKTPSRRFSKRIVMAIGDSKILGIRAGVRPHRFIGVWPVVVRTRIFVRSWNDKPDGWRQAFREDPRGFIEVAGREIRVRARKSRGERLMAAIDVAYRQKYPTPGSRMFVRGFARPKRRETTVELVPR
jgi:hypothetical protein